MDADGDFVVVWHSYGSGGTDTSGDSIQGQRYDSTGMAQGSEFQVNTYTTTSQVRASVAMDADGDFVVMWESSGSGGTDTDLSSIQAQSYNSAGMAVGSQFQVNTYTTSDQRYPSVAMDADGDFIAAWHSRGSGGSDTSYYSVQAQTYFSVNPPTPTPTRTTTPSPTPTRTPTPITTTTAQPPTAADLRYFRAIGLPDRAIVVWETASEADTLGFNVLRGVSAAGPWAPVNAAPIPAEGGAASGHGYTLRDAPGAGVWHYRLEEVGAAGKRTQHPPTEVRVGPGAEGSELFLPSAARAPK